MFRALAATALAAVLLAPPVSAAVITENYTFSGTAVRNGTNFLGLVSSSFADFNTALGTLTAINISLSGALTSGLGLPNGGVTTASDPTTTLINAVGNSIDFSASGTFATGLAVFEGAGTQALNVNFLGLGGTLIAIGSGTITYNYTPMVSSVPEPNGVAMFIIGLVALFGVMFARGVTGKTGITDKYCP